MAQPATPRKATIYDIAAAAAASPSTVSLVLNGSWARHRIKPETAHRILEMAGRLGYSVNLRARGLRLSQSGLAGMILPHYRNRFFADLAETFEAKARQRELCPIVVSTQRDPAVETQVTRTLLAQRVEFLFIVGVADPGPLNEMCRKAGVSCVNVDLPGGAAPSVVSDNRAGARRLTERLIARLQMRGGTPAEMVYLGGVPGEYATEGRVAGFSEAMQAAGVAPTGDMLACCGYPPARARAALEHWRAASGRLPAAVFVSSITALEGLVEFADSLPRAAMERLVAGCFDWDPFGAHLPFDVTMMRQDVETMMQHAFAMLDAPSQQARPFVIVPPILVEPRASGAAF